MRFSVILFAQWSALSAVLATSSVAQNVRPASLDSIPALGMDSVAGVATVYFRPVHRTRALALRALLGEYLDFYRERAGIESRMRIAVLDQQDWARLTSIPYGLPNNSGLPGNLLLVAASPPARVGVRPLPTGRVGDFLAIGHEGGHLLTWKLLPAVLTASMSDPNKDVPPDVMDRFARVGQVPRWYWEMVANYFTTAFLEAKYPTDADGWHAHLREIAGIPRPRFTHLDDWFGQVLQAMTADSTPYAFSSEGGANQGWYQGVVGLAAQHIHKQRGLDLIAHMRNTFSGEAAPTTQGIVTELDSMAPGLINLLDKLCAGYGERDAPGRRR